MGEAERYEGADPYIFISYSHADGGRVRAIAAAMIRRGYRVWFDEHIEAGKQWTVELANKIAECEIFMPFISRTFADSTYCMQEVRHAQGGKRKIVPIKLDLDRTQYPKELKFLLRNAQGFSLDSHDDAAFLAWMDSQSAFQRCRRLSESGRLYRFAFPPFFRTRCICAAIAVLRHSLNNLCKRSCNS